MMRSCLLLAPLLFPFAGCRDGEDLASADAADTCVPEPGVMPTDSGTVIVRGSDALCTLEFREIVTLRGEAGGDGALPRQPIAPGPGGTFLTSTYEDGRIAVWSRAGELVRVFGMGAGQGPGEFSLSNMLVDTVDGIVYIMSGDTHYDVYSVEGEYLRQINVPVPPALGAALGNGTIVSTASGDGSAPRLMVVRDESVAGPEAEAAFADAELDASLVEPRNVAWAGPPQRFFFPPAVVVEGGDVWTFEGPWYEINHHAEPDGRIDLVIRREDPRFPPLPDDDPNNVSVILSGLAVDAERGFAWTHVRVPDPDAPPAPRMPAEGERPRADPTPEEHRESSRARGDGVIEVFTLDGRLVGSRTFDQPEDAPYPLSAGVWYRILDDDLRSIQLLEPVLTARE